MCWMFISKALIEKDCKLDIANKVNITALIISTRNGHDGIAQLIRDKQKVNIEVLGMSKVSISSSFLLLDTLYPNPLPSARWRSACFEPPRRGTRPRHAASSSTALCSSVTTQVSYPGSTSSPELSQFNQDFHPR